MYISSALKLRLRLANGVLETLDKQRRYLDGVRTPCPGEGHVRDKVRGTTSESHRGGTARDCSVLLLVEIQRCSYHRQKKALKVLLEVFEGR